MQTRTNFVALIVFVSLSSYVFGQNLVPNGGFESYTSCPTGMSQFSNVLSWVNPTNDPSTTTPDYFNSCNTSNCSVGVPANRLAQGSFAYSGEGYAGILTYYTVPPSPDTSTREYLSVELTEPLKEGVAYTLSFYVKRSPVSFFATTVGAHLSAEALVQDGRFALGMPPNIVETTTVVDTNWMEVSSVFTSNGTEKYLTLGNFRGDSQTSLDTAGSFYDPCGIIFSEAAAYYFVDSVSIVEGNLTELSDVRNPDQMVMHPNPATHTVWIRAGEHAFSTPILVKVFTLHGELSMQTRLESSSQGLDISQLSSGGCYFLQVFDHENNLLGTDKLMKR